MPETYAENNLEIAAIQATYYGRQAAYEYQGIGFPKRDELARAINIQLMQQKNMRKTDAV
jgi:hypothetical protein